mmetsp:Transcript_31545/g.50747  ORF Transcript_31545/g.50747 Transcript_31545/m.50747 type:complete len:516 (-) Transcript_31545:93-1640(-)
MSQSNTKKTILRLKRKLCECDPAETIVLSQSLPPTKRQRTVTFDELATAFNQGFQLNEKHSEQTPANEDEPENASSNKAICIPKFFDYDFETKQEQKKSVFRLIKPDSVRRSFQQHDFGKHSAEKRKKNMLQQRRTDREQHIENIKQQMQSQRADQQQQIIQHEDINDDEQDTHGKQTKVKAKCNKVEFAKQKRIALSNFKSKLLQKQRSARGIKIASKHEIEQHRQELHRENEQQQTANASKSAFCEDWNNTLHFKAADKRTQRGIDIVSEMKGDDAGHGDEYNVIDIEFDSKRQRYIQHARAAQKQEQDDEEDDGYYYYELDADADPEQVFAAMNMVRAYHDRREESTKKEKEAEEEEEAEAQSGKVLNDWDLEWKLEKIKNKHLQKHFDASHEAKSYGVQHGSKQSELARFIELEQIEMQKHFANLGNEYPEEVEKEDENYADNEYPDEGEFSDYDHQYSLYDYHDDDAADDDRDQFAHTDRGFDNYHMFDQTDNYDDNALGIDFFNQYDLN